jgi:hypothetical protein
MVTRGSKRVRFFLRVATPSNNLDAAGSDISHSVFRKERSTPSSKGARVAIENGSLSGLKDVAAFNKQWAASAASKEPDEMV